MRFAAIKLMPLFMIAACSSEQVTEAVVPGMKISVTSPSLEVPQSSVQLVLANVERTGGFDGDVLFVIDGVPAGMRAQASGLETTDGITSALLAVAVDAGVATGDYPLVVRAVSFGLPDVATPFLVTVDDAGTPVYTLSSRPITVIPGGTASAYTSIDRGRNTLNVPVTLTTIDAPNGITVTTYPIPNYKALGTMTVTASRNVPAGKYAITVRGVAPGMADRVTTIPLTVLAGQ